MAPLLPSKKLPMSPSLPLFDYSSLFSLLSSWQTLAVLSFFMTTRQLAAYAECDWRMAPVAVRFAISLCIMEVFSGEYLLCFAACGVQLLCTTGSCSLPRLHAGTIVGFAGNTVRYFSSSWGWRSSWPCSSGLCWLVTGELRCCPPSSLSPVGRGLPAPLASHRPLVLSRLAPSLRRLAPSTDKVPQHLEAFPVACVDREDSGHPSASLEGHRLTTLHCSGVPGYHHCVPRATPTSAPVSMSYGVVGSTTTNCQSCGWTPLHRRLPVRLRSPAQYLSGRS